MSRRREYREYAIALTLLVVGAVLGIVVSGLSWASDLRSSCGDLMMVVDTVVTGRDLAPIAVAVSWAALAASVAVVATRRIGRLVVGGMLAVLGVVAVVAVATVGLQLDERATEWIELHSQCLGTPQTSWWMPVIQVAAGAMVTAAGVLTAVRGPSWPSMGAKYERQPEEATSRDAWDALDRGDDPT